MTGCAAKSGWLGILMRAFAALPLPMAHAAGALLGRLAGLFPNRNRDVTRRNLELCLPDLSPRERRRLEHRSLIETGKTLAEAPQTWCGDPEKILSRVRGTSGESAVRQALSEGRGVIIAGPHLGAWEIIGLYLGAHYPITSLYRPPDSPALEELMTTGRERTGARLVPTDAKGVRALLKRVSKGEMVGILPDQDPGYEAGVFAPFFGIPALTMTLVPKLAARSHALVVIGFAERLPEGSYHIHFVPVGDAIYDPDPALSATALNHAVEQAVQRCPEQYQWSYKRFRRRPEGEPRLYDRRTPSHH
ncbi:lysophospholipid acyltransferase family protein [Thiohalomonas denitrificans]|uniref:KDO2-lipid IV(A) lauroyltransferase n=1 Tax=Thiohalomonas denitrificans TaxID=415747 RepID=A0A1G5QZR5_9GAMM|nr:lysophospholipid acyltransferase family protein [Thiohalomonas denitrificans]SCZ67060.1 KDO2-lipid IV(A) lauroyltransferase [Thiohalomonas denitrificans]